MLNELFRNLLKTAIDKINLTTDYKCGLQNVSELSRTEHNLRDFCCFFNIDNGGLTYKSISFINELNKTILELAIKNNISERDQIKLTLIITDTIISVSNIGVYIYFKRNDIELDKFIQKNKDIDDLEEESDKTINEKLSNIEFSFPISFEDSYIPSQDFYEEIFLKRTLYLLYCFNIYKNDNKLCLLILSELENIPLSPDSIKLLHSLKSILQCDIVPPDELIESIKNIVKVGNIRSNSNGIYTLIK